MNDKQPSPAAKRAAEALEAKWSIGTSYSYDDDSGFDFAETNDIAQIIDREFEPIVQGAADMLTELRWLRDNRPKEYDALVADRPSFCNAWDKLKALSLLGEDAKTSPSQPSLSSANQSGESKP